MLYLLTYFLFPNFVASCITYRVCMPLAYLFSTFFNHKQITSRIVISISHLRELLNAIVSYLRTGFKFVAARLCKSDDRKISRWAKCKESHSLVSPTHSKRNLAVECTGYDCV